MSDDITTSYAERSADTKQAWTQRFDKDFTYHAPKGDQTLRYVELRSQAEIMAWAIAELCPPSREQSLALTCLEEAVMWANASIARNE